jgi:hypothetical protein
MRLLLCLSLCLAVGPHDPPAAAPSEAPPLAVVRDDGSALPDGAAMERLARTDPVAFLETCLRRYDREVRGYTTTFHKHERIGGEWGPDEVIDVAFRDKPLSVRFEWLKGAGRAARTLYVKGENDDQLLVRPSGRLAYRVAGIVTRDPDGPQARAASRYPMTTFGIKIGTQRVLAAWQAARKQDALHVEYLGKEKVREVGGRVCYVLRRTRFAKPEEDGITETVSYIDAETWLQVGTVLKGEDGPIAEYFFRDVRLNPDFAKDAFTRAALEK